MSYNFTKNKYIANLVFLISFAALVSYFAYALLTRPVMTNNGQLDHSTILILVALVLLIDFGLIFSALILIYQKISGNECLALTENGIEHTFIIIKIFTFILILPIKIIPWDCITNIYIEANTPIIKASIDTNKLYGCPPIQKSVLKHFGYNFGANLTQITIEEINKYYYKYSNNQKIG